MSSNEFDPAGRSAADLEVADRIVAALLAMARGDNAGAALVMQGRYNEAEVTFAFGMLLDLTVMLGTKTFGREGFAESLTLWRDAIAAGGCK